jgi:glycosyltransferase 2 family protein
VTAADVSGDEQAGPTERSSWNLSLLTRTEAGRRNRRLADVGMLLVGTIVGGLTAVIARSSPENDADVARALTTVLGWAEPLWRTAFVGLLALAVVIVADLLLRRRWDLARDVLLAVVVVAGVGVVLARVVESDWFPFEAHLLARWGYPELRLAAAIAVVVVAGPELVRLARVLATGLVPLAAIAAVVLGAAFPSAALGALAVGLGAGVLVRLAFGTAEGVPPAEQVRSELAALGVATTDLGVAPRQQMGAAAYVGQDAESRPIKVRVLGHDAQDTQRLARRWRLLAYRDPPRSAPIGRLEQVEHEALSVFMAAQAGVRVPDVVIAAAGADGDALIVTRQPAVEPLESFDADRISDELLDDLWGQVGKLHAAGISHGRLNASNVLVLEDGPTLVDLSAATLGAPQSAIDIDVAELLVACTILVGPDRVLATLVEGGWSGSVARALPYLQRAALTPHLRDLARSHEVSLDDLRKAAAAATGQQVPELVPLRRVRIRDVLVTAMIAIAAYLLITQLAEIGFGTIADELRHADVAWIVVGLLLAQCTFVGQGISLRGAVPTPLPLLPCVVLQSAIKFINLTVPSSAGRIAISIRFLQKMGTPTPQAVAAGAVDDVSETLVQIAIVLLTLPFVEIAIDTSDLKIDVPSGRTIISVLVVLALVVAAVFAVPKMRAKLLPPIRSALSSLWIVARDRRKRLELFGGNLLSELFYALTLGAACQAFGVDLTLAQLLLVNTAASAFAGLIPVPGGVGAAEATLTAGLIAMGVDDSTAFAIAFTHRLCTYYIPPIWGYFSMQWLSRQAYI